MLKRLTRVFSRKFVQDTITLQIGKGAVLVISLAGSIAVPRLMQPEDYGVWQLTMTLFSLWQLLDLTGLVPGAHTRLPEAVGARDEDALLRFMAFYLRTALIYSAASTLLLLGLHLLTPLATSLYPDSDNARAIVTMAVLLTLRRPLDMLFALFVITFSSRRQMRYVATIQSLNQLILTAATVCAVIIYPLPIALVTAQLLYSLVTCTLVMAFYQRTRRSDETVVFPAIVEIVRATTLPYPRNELGFGFSNALDKNLSLLFTLLPVQITGRVAGEVAAGQLGLALSIVRQGNFFAASVLDNLRAVIPQAVGRGDYKRLWLNFRRVLGGLAGGAILFYGTLALLAPFIPLLYGEKWVETVPLVQILVLFGLLVTLGGVFGPLYRVFNFMRGVLIYRGLTLAVGIPVGWWLIRQYGATGGAIMVVLLFALHVPLIVSLTMPELRTRARAQQV
ncbi:MAG: hypothetical protein AAF787_14405 [Chloroflexota bacterium]